MDSASSLYPQVSMDPASRLYQTNNNGQATTNPLLPPITRSEYAICDWAREASRVLPEAYDVNGRRTCLFWLRYYLRIVSDNLGTQPSELKVSSNHLVVRGVNFEYRTYTPRIFTNALRRLDQFMKAHQRGADLERSVVHPLYIEWKATCGWRLYLDGTPGPAGPEGTPNRQNSQPSRPLNPGAAAFVRLSPEAAVFQPSAPQGVDAPTHLDTPVAAMNATRPSPEAAVFQPSPRQEVGAPIHLVTLVATANATQPSPAVLNAASVEASAPERLGTPHTAMEVSQGTGTSAILAGVDSNNDYNIPRTIGAPTIAVEPIQTASEFAFSDHPPIYNENQELTESDQNGDEYHLVGSVVRYLLEHDEQNPPADAIRFAQPSWPPGWSPLSPSPAISAEPSSMESPPEGSSSSSIPPPATGTPGGPGEGSGAEDPQAILNACTSESRREIVD